MMTTSDQHATPVLLLTFNRPDTTAQVLEAIRDARPEQLFVASDGPRPHVANDADRVAQTRAVVERLVDWPCRIERRYSDTNQGCRVGVSSAISWFFEHVEEGIILEDDCVPHPDFFGYCTELLERYRDDGRIMNVAGDNSVGLVQSDPTSSYCFTKQPLIWGWATWRRAWEHYDGDLTEWTRLRADRSRQEAIWADPVERRWQTAMLNRLASTGKPDSWDYRWFFSVTVLNGLSATPAVNLIRNVGFGPGATHTSNSRNPRANVPTHTILPLRHPAAVERDLDVERQIFDRVHGGAALRNPLLRALAVGRRLAGRMLRPLRTGASESAGLGR